MENSALSRKWAAIFVLTANVALYTLGSDLDG